MEHHIRRPVRLLLAVAIATIVALFIVIPALAGSTIKTLSTNFTLINLSSEEATGVVEYLKADGSEWRSSEAFTVTADGGQAIFRQYLPGPGYIADSGQGSVVVSSDQELGAVVQILARGQTPSSGAYSGFSEGSGLFYVPLAIRQRVGASGVANSQIAVQNTGSSAVDVDIRLVSYDGSPTYTATVSSLAAGAAYLYDLADESSLNVPDGWYGSAVVSTTTSGGEVAVVSSLYTGPHAMQVFNGFSSAGTEWLVPLFVSRIPNGVSTPVTVQNLSGGTISAGGIVVTCTKNAMSGGPTTVVISNTSSVANAASYFINPVIDMSLPTNWYGACRIVSSGDAVAFVQMRKIGTDEAAAYEAIPADSTDKTVLIPLAAKRLPNLFATVTNIQNLSISSSAHVTMTYIPSPEYISGGGSSASVVITNTEIPAGGSIQHNLRLTSGGAAVTALPNGWYGTCTIESSDEPIHAFVELTFLAGSGDTWQAHSVFTRP